MYKDKEEFAKYMKDYTEITDIKETDEILTLTKIRYGIEFDEIYSKNNLFNNPFYVCKN